MTEAEANGIMAGALARSEADLHATKRSLHRIEDTGRAPMALRAVRSSYGRLGEQRRILTQDVRTRQGPTGQGLGVVWLPYAIIVAGAATVMLVRQVIALAERSTRIRQCAECLEQAVVGGASEAQAQTRCKPTCDAIENTPGIEASLIGPGGIVNIPSYVWLGLTAVGGIWLWKQLS